jgi:hypothetical protein
MKVKKIKNIPLYFWLSKKFFNLTIENLKRKPHDFSSFQFYFRFLAYIYMYSQPKEKG